MVTYINKLESVPRSFTKRLSGMHNLSYTSRLEMLGLERLETRRLHADRTMCYKIVHNLVDIPFDEFFKCSEHNSTRGHPLKLFQPVARINARAHFFLRSYMYNLVVESITKLFVRPLGIQYTKLHNKFEVCSSSSFRDIAL